MYPRFRVREQEQEQEQDELSPTKDAQTLLSSKVIGSSSEQGCSSPEKENHFDSSQSVFRTPKAYVPSLVTQSPSASKDSSSAVKDRCNGEKNKSNVRACSDLRPRAVLSSPDNDGLIGKRNKLDNQRFSVSKSNIEMKTPAGTKIIKDQKKAETPVTVKNNAKGAASSTRKLEFSKNGKGKAESCLSMKRHFNGASKSNSVDKRK
ncbi:hypothetical protein Tsubulata_005695 [Turnera subulata]|uniref:Uncharacterized protein n=1 Tax=Turnera subulata TaxID=218843 RepID=A0A9Q0GJ80_9ROSI|nr:hypothetical protein Tsubulata_005695 [Turnera subulata]